MVTKKISLLTATLILGATNFSFATPQEDKARYQVIVGSFLPAINRFKGEFVAQNQDISIVTEHKEALEHKVAEYKASWVPFFLKVAGTGFGIGAGIEAISGAVEIVPYKYEYEYYKEKIYNTLSYLQYASLRVGVGIMGKARHALHNMHYSERSISETAYCGSMASLSLGNALLSASVATWLFKKANSYKNTITKLEAEIAIDDNMITVLEKL